MRRGGGRREIVVGSRWPGLQVGRPPFYRRIVRGVPMDTILDATLALLALLIAASLVARKISFQEPLLFVLTGLVVSFIPGLPAIALDPELVMDVFLPLLVYATAVEVPWREFRANLGPSDSSASGSSSSRPSASPPSRTRSCPGFNGP